MFKLSQERTDSTMTKIKKDKKTNNDLQNTAQNTRDYETRTSHKKPGVNSVALEG